MANYLNYERIDFPVFKGALSGLRQILAAESPFQNDEKCFVFHLKSSLRSQDI